jgi:hypothetical protein
VRSALCTRRLGARVSWFSFKTKVEDFSRFASKLVAMVLVVWPQNYSLGFPNLLRLEVSQTRVSQSSLKTGGGMMQMVHVASSLRSCGDEAEDGRVNATGCIRLFYPNFAIFVVLDHKCSLVVSFPINRTPRAFGVVSIQPSLSHP